MSDKTIDFINKSREVHGDNYDYSKVVYENNLKEVIIICKHHGEFKQLPKTHKRGNGCQTCGLLKSAISRKSDINDFINKATEIHGDKYDYSNAEYKSAKDKIKIICKKHGEFLQTPNGHLDGKGCRECSTEINSDKQRKTTIQFIEDAKKIHGDKYDYSNVEYKSTGENVIIICKEHGRFLQTPNNHLSKASGCIQCAGCYKSNTEEFIEKAKKIHGDNYDYSKVEYTNVRIQVTIICKKHGEFQQSPNGHLNGNGCYKCGYNMYIFTNEDFIDKATEIHGDKYDYSKINYTKMNEKVIIICRSHGEFEQTPSSHITHKSGCQTCAGKYLSNTEEFINKSKEIHGDKYDYTKVNYTNNHTDIIIICKEHGEFLQTPQMHLSRRGCRLCGIESMKLKQRTSIEDFIQNAKKIHGDKYDYSKVEYINANIKVIIICKQHGEFNQAPTSHLIGAGCSKCAGNCLSNTEEFINKAQYIHGNKYDYTKVNYIKSNQKIIINCRNHGEFEQTPSNHLHGYGCKNCSSNYSKMQIAWLKFLEKLYNITIIHQENGGEYTIPNTKYKADGYCEKNNTIYEFHGDYWHGNPNRYDSNDINKTTNCSFGELYQNTLKKEQKIKECGFNLITIWESDWIKLIKSIRILQIKFIKYMRMIL